MATTPRPYLWQSLQLRASEANYTGGMAHYFTEEAQSLYIHNGIASKQMYVEDGHWQDAQAGEEEVITDVGYTQISWHHPATGSLYGTAILPDDNSTILYLLRYTYIKEIGDLISSGNYRAEVDNPIVQVNADVKNYDSDAFTKNETLFIPGARVTLGLTMGDSPIYNLCETFIDQVDFNYNKASVGISSRNNIGVTLSENTINQKGKKTGTISYLSRWVLEHFEINDALIEENNAQITLEYQASDTGMKLMETIAEMASGVESGTDWAMEEMPNGIIVVGFNGFRGQYLPKSVFKFGHGELFRRSSVKSADGAYTKVYVTGKNSGGRDLDPVIMDVTQWKHWRIPTNKTYFAPTLENTTQEEMTRYAQTLVKQLKRTGLTETYNTTIKPQLLVGDYATIQENGVDTDIGVINQITHTFGERGFYTDFVADSGGDKQVLLTRSLSSSEKVFTSSRKNGGMNRNRRLYDFIRNTTTDIVRTASAGGGGGGSSSGVQDVTVDGVTVVDEGVAKVVLTGKQDKLTAGERITINGATISASIDPFSVVDGKMCITFEEE
jgi:hypothetical protein